MMRAMRRSDCATDEADTAQKAQSTTRSRSMAPSLGRAMPKYIVIVLARDHGLMQAAQGTQRPRWASRHCYRMDFLEAFLDVGAFADSILSSAAARERKTWIRKRWSGWPSGHWLRTGSYGGTLATG